MSDPKVHLLPFSIDREGPINTDSYFKVEKQDDQYETVILGRKLVGTGVSLKETLAEGHIWEKHLYEEEEEDDNENTAWTKSNIKVKEFILWKKDTAPNTQDPRINAIHNWIDISQSIHTSIPLP